jgi:hypothetical protein
MALSIYNNIYEIGNFIFWGGVGGQKPAFFSPPKDVHNFGSIQIDKNCFKKTKLSLFFKNKLF